MPMEGMLDLPWVRLRSAKGFRILFVSWSKKITIPMNGSLAFQYVQRFIHPRQCDGAGG